MITHALIQGSPEWLAHRAKFFNASDAAAMLGCSPHETRSDLLREMYVGMTRDPSSFVQDRILAPGHGREARARPIAEQILGEDLYPIVGTDGGRLGASFDGLTLAGDVVFEHKSASAELRAILSPPADAEPVLPKHYRAQLEQQLMVSGAERALFMATLWDGDECTFERHCWYEPDAELRAEILRGWDQFAKDLADYTLPAAAEPAPVGNAPETLPALRIEIAGAVTASNLAEFKQTALAAIRGVNRDLKTDADLADAEKAVKWCGDIESRLAAAKEHALSQTADIDALFKTIDDISSESKRVRLDLDKLLTRRKTEIKERAVVAAFRALEDHVATLNAEIAPMRLPAIAADFAGAIKGKRSIDSMQDALDTTLAMCKIAADSAARAIRANLFAYHAKAKPFDFLFADLSTLVHKPESDFCALIDARIANHKAAEARKEQERQAAEDARIAAAEQRARDQEAARIAAQQAEAARIAALAKQREQDAAAESARVAVAALAAAVAPPPPPPVSEPSAAEEPANEVGSMQGWTAGDEARRWRETMDDSQIHRLMTQSGCGGTLTPSVRRFAHACAALGLQDERDRCADLMCITTGGLLTLAGEMTAGELRCVRAVLAALRRHIETPNVALTGKPAPE